MADVAIQSLLQGMKSDNKQVQGASSNIPNSKSSGFREFVDHYVSDADKFGGGVSIKRTMNFYKEGAIQETGMSYNIAIEGNKGLFYVSNNGEILNTRSGDFFKNKDDFVENVNGAFLMGLPYDENGVMAEVNETELRKVKINTVDVLEPLATSKVDVDLNLNASANIIGGGSLSLDFNSISASNNDQSFEIKAYVKKNDGTVGEKVYKFTYKNPLSTGVISRKESNVIEIEFNTAEQLKSVLNGDTDIPSESNDKIKIQDVIGKAEYNSGEQILYFNARADKDGNVSSRIELVEGDNNGLLEKMGLGSNTRKGQIFEMKQNYSPYDSLNNMAGGNVRPDFSKEFTIIDDLGKKHVAIIALKRLDALKWASEVFVAKGEALSEESRVDGLVSAGTIEFDSKTGKLAAQGINPPESASMTSNVPIKSDLKAPKNYTYQINLNTVTINKNDTLHQIAEKINTAGGSSNFKASVVLGVNGNYRLRLETQNNPASGENLIKIDPQATTTSTDSSTIDEAKDFLEITLGLQTEMKSITPLQKDTKLVFDWNQKIYGSASTQLELDFDKLTMYAQDFSGEANSNGRVPGFFQGISIDNDGNILGKYTNGDTKKLYNLPLGYFNNPGGLEPIDGGMFRESAESGSRKMALAGKEGTGRLVGERLELSNTDTNEQLTNVIEANSNYTAAAKAFGIKLRMNDTLYKEI